MVILISVNRKEKLTVSRKKVKPLAIYAITPLRSSSKHFEFWENLFNILFARRSVSYRQLFTLSAKDLPSEQYTDLFTGKQKAKKA